METLAAPTKLNEQIRATDLINVLKHHLPQIKVLSLDCFDTLLWRNTAEPKDVFYDLQQKPTFQSLGLTSFMRIRSEANARIRQFLQHISNEVTLKDIYQDYHPALTQEQLNALETEELSAETEACFAFPPVVELIREAIKNNLKIVIVSDTYLSQQQLRQLLSTKLPDDVLSSISMIFCSNEFGRSKVNGLFQKVIEKLNISASSILHIGDNPAADLAAAKQQKINAFQLIQYDDCIHELLRMKTTSASFMDPAVRHSRALCSPFRGVYATQKISADTPEQIIGYASLGPIMYSFARFLCDEVEALKKAGKHPKVLFLMRDAYLPAKACETILGKPLGSLIRISRFSSHAAAFRSVDDVDRYLADVITSNRFADMAKQLLLPEEVYKPLIQTTLKSEVPTYKFVELIHQKHILDIIFKNSAEFRAKLIRYIKKEMGTEHIDTLMFVDIGYSGTTQRLLEPILREELKLDVTGRYLMVLSSPNWKNSRRGLIDPTWCDDRATLMIITYVALLEQLCTLHEKSSVGYDNDGNPIFSETILSDAQQFHLERIQSNCLQFVKDANHFFNESNQKLSLSMLQDSALSEITRLLFLPTESEIQYLKSFEFDLNCGTKDVFQVFDAEKGLQGLKRRGFFSLFLEKNAKSFRTNRSIEMRAASLELALTLMGQHRFLLEFTQKDLSLRREKINLIIMRGTEATQVSIDAQITFDGYFAFSIPVVNDMKVGILLGQRYKWVQLESAELVPGTSYLTTNESKHTQDAWNQLVFNQMVAKDGNLFECLSDQGFAMFIPTNINGKFIFRFAFRPIVQR